MLKKVDFLEIKQELFSLIDTLDEEQMKRTYEWIMDQFVEVDTVEMDRWWAENIESKPRVALNLSKEEIREMDEDERVSWEGLKKQFGSDV